MAVVNLKELFQRAFNVAPRYLIPNYSDLQSLPREYSGIEIFPEDGYAELSPLGTPILEKITIRAGSYNAFKVVDGLPVPKSETYSSYTFPLWPMIDVSQNKVVVKTPITGRDGTIKEYIYRDDHRITIRGLLVGEGNSYPYNQKQALYRLFEQNASLEIVSQTLNELGVQAIVIENIEFSDIEGFNNVCPFTITAISDMPVLLMIREAPKK